MIENVISQVQSAGLPSSRKRRPMTPAATRKPTAKQIPNVWIVSGPRWISGCICRRDPKRAALEVVQGVLNSPVDAHLEMQVRPKAEAGAATEPDDLALAHA